MANYDKNKDNKNGNLEEIKDTFTPTPVEEKEHEDSLKFADEVIEKIAALAAREIEGVLDLKGGLLSGMQESFGGYNVTKGVDAEVGESEVIINMKMILEFGKSAPRIFDELRQYVGMQLKEMTGLNLAELNVEVVDVMTQRDFQQKKNEQNNNQLG